ncbi:MAG TPA: penicillin-binding protein 2 [Gordonia sp. (in: high G+C Gram-positive bacteria)]|uniref:peptidoglycan D,D-transpeptidase FtsI family protein n=1 Tax=unclassified Gordonia (in: high G+C Gram-positive bacteria) TaxID=2657482 RepID=UPI000FA45BF3|nr:MULTISPECIES: penicillin-binding protein 2 [unclassified Gordonia (in: high G+C Gram-positive bacteria)]RUP38398.1 MAG: penicillin-binding protein 2 [Gordonia sp. (in: high G+C Gram-positive bacteria)]HNP58262.1 penicillin-binding protein 2 [Gordonia sp. (in: high G+C Gram-positive bacteria)]HRC52375.1 penicillin-binding protein 2 [Gordonia sp. (in: high G+C Gram-positive bacteria)]
MNKPIQRVGLFVCLLVVALLANATYIQVIHANELRSDSRNSRVLIDEYARQRGAITAGGDVIASSDPTDGRLRFLRTYPADTAMAFAPVTGYFSFQYRSSGLELAEDAILNGNDDRLFGQRFMDMFAGRDPRGGNVLTTIRPEVQKAAYEALRNGRCDGGCRGAVVAIEPSTGKILALASSPSYDPNKLASHNQQVRENAWTSWSNPPNKADPMLNRPLDQLYPPGSTFKVITTAAALRDGVDPNIRLTAARSITLPGSTATLTNYGNQTCPGAVGGTVTLAQAFQYSCNTAFVDLVVNKLKQPETTLAETAKRFGLDEATQAIPLPVRAKSTLGDVSDRAALGQSAIGQYNVRMSALQNAIIAATVANGGVRMQPYLVDKLQGPDLRTLSTTSPATVNEPITAAQAATLTSLMIDSERQSGGPATIASKTGTAEHSAGPGSGEVPYAWYIAFGPSTNAQIAVAVVVENGQLGTGTTGAAVAAPIGRDVIEAALRGGGGR